MKRVFMVIVAVLSICYSGRFATASDLGAFKQIKARFYSLDRQNFKSISCHVDVPTLDREISAMNFSLHGKARINATLGSYRLVYKRPRKLMIHDPVAQLEVIAKDEVKDPARLKLGERQFERGFKGQVDGIDNMLKGLFSGYETLDPKKLRVEDVSESIGMQTLHYWYDGTDIVEVISGNMVTSKQHKSNVFITSEEHYRNLPSGELILNNATAHVKNPLRGEDIRLSVDYQDVSGRTFPEIIDTLASVKTPKAQMASQIHIVIRLRNCVSH